MFISSSGNVWIGANSPNMVLDVNGNIKAKQLKIENGAGDGITNLIDLKTTAGTDAFTVKDNGYVYARELIVKRDGWEDRVFENDYKLLTLTELENFITQNKHLPGIPTEADVLKNGIKTGEMDALLLNKVEELTLYLIEQNKKIDILIKENVELKNKLNNEKN